MSVFSYKTWLVFIVPLVLCFLAGALISEILQWRRRRREGILSAGDLIGGALRCAASVLWVPLGMISVILFFSLLILYAYLRVSPKRRSFSAFAWDIGVALLFFFPLTLLCIRLINWADTLV